MPTDVNAVSSAALAGLRGREEGGDEAETMVGSAPHDILAKAAGDRFSALASGAVDVAILNPPSSFRAADLGFVALGEIKTYIHEFPFTVWAANSDWAARNKAAGCSRRRLR